MLAGLEEMNVQWHCLNAKVKLFDSAVMRPHVRFDIFEYELLSGTIRNPFPRLRRRSDDMLPREKNKTHDNDDDRINDDFIGYKMISGSGRQTIRLVETDNAIQRYRLNGSKDVVVTTSKAKTNNTNHLESVRSRCTRTDSADGILDTNNLGIKVNSILVVSIVHVIIMRCLFNKDVHTGKSTLNVDHDRR